MEKQVFNPFLPSWEYVPDGEPRVFGDRLYLYGSHDAFNGSDFCVNDYVCWSAPLDDLSDWRYEGVIYRKEQDPRNRDGKMHMCAPDCVQGPDGRFYLYYQLHALTCTCVAVADTPVGPFEYYGCVHHPDGTPWGEKKGDSFAFDPGVLVDDDGKVYLYVGFSPEGLFKHVFKLRGNKVDGSVCLELEQDMITVKGGEHPIVPGPVLARGTDYEGHGFFEASSIRKIGGKYFYIYSSILSHELCYAVSDKPTEGFRYGGTLVSIADIGLRGNTTPLNYTGNTHGGMCEVNGQWYIFYHRQTNRIKCSRQACAEKLTILPDGSIPQVEVTSCGLNDGPLSGKGQYEARIACNLGAATGMVKSDEAKKKDKKNLLPTFTQSGEDREANGDQYIANLQHGSWCGFKYFAFDGTESKLIVTVRGSAAGTLKVYTDCNLPPVASVPVKPSDDWTEYSEKLEITAGEAPLYFVYEGGGSLDFSVFEIE
ncbi:MAG: family 43 glycosylhydrolase [Candidatus Onthomonas sp.]|nr:family 43 glycosylhydrolase [Candidatus Onthomonas sp.]